MDRRWGKCTHGGSLLVNVCILLIIEYSLYKEVIADGERLMPQKDRWSKNSGLKNIES